MLIFTILGKTAALSRAACSSVGKLAVPNCFMASRSRFL